eukprot:jgi/Bigna1/136114/aug1.32_g10822
MLGKTAKQADDWYSGNRIVRRRLRREKEHEGFDPTAVLHRCLELTKKSKGFTSEMQSIYNNATRIHVRLQRSILAGLALHSSTPSTVTTNGAAHPSQPSAVVGRGKDEGGETGERGGKKGELTKIKRTRTASVEKEEVEEEEEEEEGEVKGRGGTSSNKGSETKKSKKGRIAKQVEEEGEEQQQQQQQQQQQPQDQTQRSVDSSIVDRMKRMGVGSKALDEEEEEGQRDVKEEEVKYEIAGHVRGGGALRYDSGDASAEAGQQDAFKGQRMEKREENRRVAENIVSSLITSQGEGAGQLSATANTPGSHTRSAAATSSSSSSSSSVYVSGLPFATSAEELRTLFRDCGPILEVRVPRSAAGKPKGYAFVDFGRPSTRAGGGRGGRGVDATDNKEGQEAALAALELDQIELKGRYLNVSLATNKNYEQPYDRPLRARPPFCKTVFVGNLHWDVEEEELKKAFLPCGVVKDVRIAFRGRRPLGYAHVEFATERAVDAIRIMTGARIRDRPMRIDYAAPMSSKTRRKGQRQ